MVKELIFDSLRVDVQLHYSLLFQIVNCDTVDPMRLELILERDLSRPIVRYDDAKTTVEEVDVGILDESSRDTVDSL
jgi:hypothetical protein